jgi:hypothetical protein
MRLHPGDVGAEPGFVEEQARSLQGVEGSTGLSCQLSGGGFRRDGDSSQ